MDGADLVGQNLPFPDIFVFFRPVGPRVEGVFRDQLFIFDAQPHEQKRSPVAAVAAAERGEVQKIRIALKDDPVAVFDVVVPLEDDHVAHAVVHDAVDALTGFQERRRAGGAAPRVVEGHGGRADNQRHKDQNRHGRDKLHQSEGGFIRPEWCSHS